MATPDKVAADLAALGIKAGARSVAITRYHGQLLLAGVKRRASLPRTGPPGPRIQTGNYVRSMSVVHGMKGGSPTATVGSNAPQGRRLEMGFTGTDSIGRVYCVDEATEAMTSEGWRHHSEIDPGTLLLTLNADTMESEWQPATDVSRFPGPHDFYVVEGRTASLATTADHRWLIERYYGRRQVWVREWRTTADMPANARIPIAAKRGDAPTAPVTDDDVVELVGWFWTEGTYNWSRRNGDDGNRHPTTRPIGIAISQSPKVNPEHCERIRALLTRIFGPPGAFADGAHWHERTSPQTGVSLFKIDRVGAWLVEPHVAPPHKGLKPSFLRSLTVDQLELLIEVSLAADGHIAPDGMARLGQGNEARIRTWEMACVLAGRPITTRFRERRAAHHGDTWTTSLLRRSWSHAFGSALRSDRDHASVKIERKDELAWCPTTPNGTWLARRNGTVYFTGNSQRPYPHWGPALDEVAPLFVAAIAALADPT